MAHLPTRGQHPCERRVDGERVTEMLPAQLWLNRDDANKLQHRADGPPVLPRHQARDHLHDRNREQSLFDPASPGVTTYVRATRRRLPSPDSEQQQRNALAARQRDQHLREQREAEEANELLELRSMGIKAMMNERQKGEMFGNTVVRVPPENPRVTQLTKNLGVDKVQLVSSPLQIDTTAPAGHNTMAAPAPAPAPAPAFGMRGQQTTLRGNTWPTQDGYFSKR